MLENLLNKTLGGIVDKGKELLYDKFMGKDSAEILEIRKSGNKAAILFIHGFSGNAGETWGEFPNERGR